MCQFSTPRYEHDCSSCNFLGQVGRDDAYFCPSEGSIVLRASSEVPDYASFPKAIAECVAESHGGARWAVALELANAEDLGRRAA